MGPELGGNTSPIPSHVMDAQELGSFWRNGGAPSSGGLGRGLFYLVAAMCWVPCLSLEPILRGVGTPTLNILQQGAEAQREHLVGSRHETGSFGFSSLWQGHAKGGLGFQVGTQCPTGYSCAGTGSPPLALNGQHDYRPRG